MNTPADHVADDADLMQTPVYLQKAEAVALVALQGLLASGKYSENPQAATTAAFVIADDFLLRAYPAFIDFTIRTHGSIPEPQAASIDPSKYGV